MQLIRIRVPSSHTSQRLMIAMDGSGQSLSGVGLDTPDTRPTLGATAASEVCVVVRDHTNVSQVRNRVLIQELMKESGDFSAEGNGSPIGLISLKGSALDRTFH